MFNLVVLFWRFLFLGLLKGFASFFFFLIYRLLKQIQVNVCGISRPTLAVKQRPLQGPSFSKHLKTMPKLTLQTSMNAMKCPCSPFFSTWCFLRYVALKPRDSLELIQVRSTRKALAKVPAVQLVDGKNCGKS